VEVSKLPLRDGDFAQWPWKFLKQMLHVFRHRIRDQLLAMGLIADKMETEGSAICKASGEKDLAVAGAVAVQANSSLLVP
jgi:hypothetical protein